MLGGREGLPFWRAMRGKVRRAWAGAVRPAYVRAQLARRQGQCLRCGACCRLGHRCLALVGRNRCLIYGVARPRNCVLFPLDERDLADVSGQCGFSFAGTTGDAKDASPGGERRGA